jgi:hypothetical protein
MFYINNLTNNDDVKTIASLGAFSVIEYQRDLSVMPSTAQTAYYCNAMNVRKRQVLCDLRQGNVTVQAGAMQWSAGNVNATTGIKGVGDLLGKAVRGKVTGESAIKPEYTGDGLLVLEPTYKHILLIDVAEWGSILLDDGLFLACESSLQQKAIMRTNLSSAALGGEGLFNLGISGKGILCPSQLVMENDGRDIGTVGKDGAVQSGDTLRNGEGTAERGRAEIQDTAVCIVQEAVLGRESGVARGNVDVLQSGTTCKSTAVEGGQACGEMNGGQGGTVQEGIGIYRGDPFGKGHFLQGRTAAEGIFSDRSDACRELDGFKKGTVGKSVVSHGSKVSDQGHVFDICHLTSPGDVIRAVKVQSAGAGDSHLTGVSVQSPLSSGEGAVPDGPLCRGVCKKGAAVPTFGGGREDEQRQ